MKRVVAVMGSTLSPAQEESVVKHTNSESRIVLMLDEDDAGRIGREQALQRLAAKTFVKVFKFPKEGQQPDQLSAEEIHELLTPLHQKERILKIYEGIRQGRAVDVIVNGCRLDPRFDLWNHSPTGFEWGYGGSGPAQLALALLADHLDNDDEAVVLHQYFKRAVVEKLPSRHWTLISQQIDRSLSVLKSSLTAEVVGN